VDFVALIEPIARALLGEPNQALSSKTELRYGARGSLAVDLKKGTWYDHELGEGGGAIDLIRRQINGGDVSQWLKEHGFENRTNGSTGRLGKIVATYDYPDEVGQLLFQVVRFDPKDFRQRRPDKSKPDGWSWSVKGVRQVPYRLPDLLEHIDRVVFIVEGEKDCDRLWSLGIPSTTNAGGAGKWRPDLTEFFRGADVVIIPDFDPPKRHPKTNEVMLHPDGRPVLPGQDHAQDVALALNGVAQHVRVLELWRHWKQMPRKGDVSDWFQAGYGINELYTLVEQTPEWIPGQETEIDSIPLIDPFPLDDKDVNPRDWVVPGLLMRRHVTVLVAPSGVGKSLLTLQWGIACVEGKAWADWRPREVFNVLVINSEDETDEMKRRLIAALYIMGVEQRDLKGKFRLADNPDGAVIAKFDAKTKTLVRTPWLERIVATVIANKIDIVFVDPFAETFEGDENSNSELKWAGVLWREVARRANCAVCLIHHTKKYATGMAGDVDAARGAGALIGIARIVSTLFPMTAEEAKTLLTEQERARRLQYLRYDDAKANLNLVTSAAKWFYKETVTLANARPEHNQPGDQVGALKPWKPKGIFADIDDIQIKEFFGRLDRGILNEDGDPSGEFWTLDSRKQSEAEMSRYVGDFVESFFHVDFDRAVKMITAWRKAGQFKEDKYKSPTSRKMRTRVRSKNATNGHATQAESQQQAML
jgi:RecA-family ATPase